MKMKCVNQCVALIFFVVLLMFSQPHTGSAQESNPESTNPESSPAKKAVEKIPVKMNGKTLLPLRVLARPMSNIYKEPNEKSAIVEENVPVFQSYFVYTRPEVKIKDTKPEGWYEVGNDNRGTVLGWMKAEDVMEWKQTMCLAYKHPEGRHPVLMFEKVDELRKLVKSADDDRKKSSEAYYQQIKAKSESKKDLPKDFPVISIEPKDAIDITEQFYLLPILEYAPVEIENREGRLLKIASAPKEGRGTDTLESKNSADSLEGSKKSELLKKIQADIVYVVDMTQSMHPYIKATLEAVNDMARLITQDASGTEKIVHFGLWGYRDSTDIPGIEFHTKNFTPELQSVGDFEKTVAEVEQKQKSFNTGSEDYPEDVFSGIDKAMQESKWTADAIRILILMGDAPSHKPGHKWNLSGKSADTLRIFASDNKFSILSLHIKDPGAQEYWELAEEQFRTLSGNRGLEDNPSYWSVDAKNMDAFSEAAKNIANEFVKLAGTAKKGETSSPPGDAGSSSASSKSQDSLKLKLNELWQAALTDWLGKEGEVKAPRDITAWVTDKDLIDPSVQSLDVRVLINKKEIDSLRTVLQEIMTAGRRGIIAGEKFFSALQAVPSAASRGGDQIKNALSLSDTGLIPEFMHDLPYQSQIMGLNNDLWASWSPDQQEEFLNEIDAKIKLYASIHDNPKMWVPLNKGNDPDEYVCAVSLEALP